MITMTGTMFGLLISIHFLTIKRPGIATKWLGLYTLVLTSGLAEPLISEYTDLEILFGGLSLLYGPFLYLYIKSRILSLTRIDQISYRHFLPFVMYTVGIIGSYVLTQNAGREYQTSEVIDIVLYEMLFMQIFSYSIGALVFIRRNKFKAADEDAAVIKMKLAFMQLLVLLSIALFLSTYVATHIALFANIQLAGFNYAIQIALCIIIFMIALVNTETMHAKKLIKAF
jgi:hypothetical protein